MELDRLRNLYRAPFGCFHVPMDHGPPPGVPFMILDAFAGPAAGEGKGSRSVLALNSAHPLCNDVSPRPGWRTMLSF